MSGEVTRMTWSPATCRCTWQPTPQYGQTERTVLSGWSTFSGANRSRGITSKIAPVGQTRTHSPHQVHPALSGSPVAVAQDEVALPERRGNDPVTHDVLLELVAGPRPLPVAVAQVLARVALEQQPEHAFAVFNRRVGLALHHHPLRRLSGTGREQFRLPLHRHQADTAIPDYRQLGIPAQRGDVQDPRGAGCFEDGLFGVGTDRAAVDREGRHDLED